MRQKKKMPIQVRRKCSPVRVTRSTRTAGWSLMMSMPLPACNPMNAKNIPIPAIVAFIIHAGKILKIMRRMSSKDMTMKITP